ncbi:hypothetical protein QNH46_15305 [Paenibacillus woosongensis]|uniref:Uncharacterized protein n=1 Tax=Paenibacillus woosongensis TaxID=307580 RepID=A0AA95HZ48_9BACL|nr:hypothetical protein [Paenibacillus woosongensis]WHX47519.1 hypothetical protein QNH46_15305 [Paenibacillus woosongensis]
MLARVRNKAIEIANALLEEGYEEGYEEGSAIAIGTAKAHEWDDNHPKHHDDKKIMPQRQKTAQAIRPGLFLL